MKKFLLLGFLILFVLSTSVFAGMKDIKKESEKPAVLNPIENKTADDGIISSDKSAGIDYTNATISDQKSTTELKKHPKNHNQDVVVRTNHPHGNSIYIGGGGLLLLIIILIIVF
jgi:hypothetical protein